jgi:hypothetical protein
VRLLAIVGAIVVLVLIFVVARELMRWNARRSELSGRWAPTSRSISSGKVAVRLECPGETPLVLVTLDPADTDFDDKLHEAMAEARQRAAALNSERGQLGM